MSSEEKKITVGEAFTQLFFLLLAILYFISSFGAWTWNPLGWPEWARYVDAILLVVGGCALYAYANDEYGDGF